MYSQVPYSMYMYMHMYMCMYVYVYVCICVCMYMCMYVCIYVFSRATSLLNTPQTIAAEATFDKF